MSNLTRQEMQKADKLLAELKELKESNAAEGVKPELQRLINELNKVLGHRNPGSYKQ